MYIDPEDIKKTLSTIFKKGSNRIVYTDIHDCINEIRYRTLTPTYYEPNLPKEFLNGDIVPFYNEPDIYSMDHSRSSIADMIDMRSKNIRFELENKEDIITIKYFLDSYLGHIRNYYSESPKAKEYMEKASVFERELNRNYDKLMNSSPYYRVMSANEVNGLNDLLGRLYDDQPERYIENG